MEISNIFKSKADRMIMSPHMPVTLLQQLGNCFSLFSHCSRVCVCVYINILVRIYICVCVSIHTRMHIYFF